MYRTIQHRIIFYSSVVGLCYTGFLTIPKVLAWQKDEAPSRPARIGIIGGGIGGTATAYFLKELFQDDALIDLYESGVIGGRLATANINGQEYETGGSIIHPGNKYMVDFASKLGLGRRSDCDEKTGLFNGAEYVFVDSSYSIVTIAKLIWRYGWDAFKLDRLTNSMLANFAKIYNNQADGMAYKDVSSMLNSMDPLFVNMTKMSTMNFLKSQGFQDKIIDEIVMAVTRANYGQSTDIHSFVGAISVAGADPDLWAVEGGNKKVPEGLLKYSRASWLQRHVTKIAPTEKGTFTIYSIPVNETHKTRLLMEGDTINAIHIEENPKEEQGHEYDIIIIATPLTSDKSSIKFENFTENFKFPGHYERIVCTIVDGRVKPTSLKIPKGLHLDAVLTTNPRLAYNAIGRQYPVEGASCSSDGYDGIWKIFSPRPLTEAQLKETFRVRRSTTVVDWLAYPHYKSNQTLDNFELVKGLYYVNAIEKAGSAMEMSSIGAKNAALLAYKYWMNDESAGRLFFKEEL